MVKEYTQVVQPVSRVPEKIFGWLGWIALLALTVYLAFFSLFQARDGNFMQEVRNMAGEATEGTDLTPDQFVTVIEQVTQNLWMLGVLLLIPLILSFIGLVKMRKRILAGILLLISAILIAPLLFTLFTSLMFVIAAILLFARKDRIITEGATGEYMNRRPDYARDNYDTRDRSVTHKRGNKVERRAEEHNQEELERLDKEKHDRNAIQSYEEEQEGYEDLEKTKQFSAVDENIASQEIDYPVTDAEYDQQEGYDVEEEDAARTRRENVNRRNNDSL